jgi:hypothetical protein
MNSSKEYVAVDLLRCVEDIKRHLVLFDRIAIVHQKKDWEFIRKDPSAAADLDWLEEKGLVFKTDQCLRGDCGEFHVNQLDDNIFRVGNDILDSYIISKPRLHQIIRRGTVLELEDNLRAGIHDMMCRWEAQRIAKLQNVQTVSLST